LKIESDVAAEFGRWTVDGHPRCIEFGPSFWGAILPAVMADFLRLPWGGPEVGGVLFGRREPSGVQIQAFRALECEHLHGPAFELAEEDESRLANLLAKANTDERLAGLEAVGWYHSKHHWLVLAERDVKLFDKYFPEAWQIAMVFLRAKSQPCLLGLFFRRADGSIGSSHREFSAREAKVEVAAEESAPPAPHVDPRQEDVLTRLMRAIRERKGLMVLSGEAGVGKTALLGRLGDLLRQERIQFALLLDSRLSVERFYGFLAYDLALPSAGQSKIAILTSLRELLTRQAARGSTVALLVDDAQHLEGEVLEEIRMLDNLQHRTGRLLQTVLCGTPELERRLESEELRQFGERVSVRCRLQPPTGSAACA